MKKIIPYIGMGKLKHLLLVLYHNIVTDSEEPMYLSSAAPLFTHDYCQRGIKL